MEIKWPEDESLEDFDHVLDNGHGFEWVGSSIYRGQLYTSICCQLPSNQSFIGKLPAMGLV